MVGQWLKPFDEFLSTQQPGNGSFELTVLTILVNFHCEVQKRNFCWFSRSFKWMILIKSINVFQFD